MKLKTFKFSALIGTGVVAALLGAVLMAQPTPARADSFALVIGQPYYHHDRDRYWHDDWIRDRYAHRDWRWRDREWRRDRWRDRHYDRYHHDWR